VTPRSEFGTKLQLVERLTGAIVSNRGIPRQRALFLVDPVRKAFYRRSQ